MLQLRRPFLFILIITIFGSFFAWKIVNKAYGDAYDFNVYDGGDTVPVVHHQQ